jgi:hypothetical protein
MGVLKSSSRSQALASPLREASCLELCQRALERRAAAPGLLSGPRGFLSIPLMADGLYRAILVELVDLYPSAVALRGNYLSLHLYRAEPLLEALAALGSSLAHGLEDLGGPGEPKLEVGLV